MEFSPHIQLKLPQAQLTLLPWIGGASQNWELGESTSLQADKGKSTLKIIGGLLPDFWGKKRRIEV